MTRTLLAFMFLAAPAAAQPPLPPPGPDAATVRGESPRTRKRLAEIEQHILAGKSAGAADELQRVLDEAGDDLIAVDAHRHVPARRYAHRFLAQLPAAALAAYQDRIDEPARRLLEQGRSARDPEPLRRLIDRYFVSRPAENAILLLGELAFERGQFRAAEGCWRRLLPDADEFPYPAPRTDPAAVRAKVVLAVVFQGELDRAKELLATFREKHPGAAGRLAGKSGNYADTLAELIADPPHMPPDNGEGGWGTFAGNPARDGRVGVRLPYHWPSRPTWATPIPRDPAAATDRYPAKPPPVGAARSVAFHPVVAGGRAYLADAGRVFGFDLDTGRVALVYDIRRDDPFCLAGGGDLKLPVRYDADFTLTAAGDALFARLGQAAVFPQPAPNQPAPLVAKRMSYLVCLDVAGDRGKVKWSKAPPVPDPGTAAWEGAPVVADGRVLAAFVRTDGGRAVHTLACIDDAGRRLLWTADLTENGTGGEGRYRHELLTLAGPNVVFCSHTGAVVATDARSGKPAWAFRYPRAKKAPGESRYRDINPPVAAGGRLFVAPTDAEYLFALDAETGRLLWQAGPVEVDQVVGVAGGKVVCTIAGPVRGVRGFDAATGSTVAQRGWVQHDDPGLSSFGRGLVSDEVVAWPTQAGLFALRTRDGMPARQPVWGPHGNLAFADGVLLCATPTELWGYVTPARAKPPGEREENGGDHRWVNLADMPSQTGEEILDTVRAGLASRPDPRPPTPPRARPVVHTPVTVSESPLPAPATNNRPAQDPVPDVSSVVRTASRTIARVGDSHVVAVDRQTGRLAWVLDSLKRRQFDPYTLWPGRRFLAPVYADDDHVIAFTTAGRRWVIDARSGEVVYDQPGAAPEFVSTPARATEHGIAVATGPSSVAVIDTRSEQTAWEYNAERPASLMGTAPRVWSAADSVFVAVARNVGVEIDRLHPADGRRLWPDGPVFLPANAIDPTAATCGPEQLFVPYNHRLAAVRLDSGRPDWDAALPVLPGVSGWAAHAAANAVFAVPNTAVLAEPFPDSVARVGWSFATRPAVHRLPGLVATLYDAWVDRTAPVLVFDPATGRQLQRLDLPARGPSVFARLAADGLTVATGAAAYRLK